MRYKIKTIILGMLLAPAAAHAAADTTIVVSPSQGEEALMDALQQAREYKRKHVSADAYQKLDSMGSYPWVDIRLKAGTYRLYQPLQVRPEDSNLRFVGEAGAHIVGSLPITKWRKEGKYLVADVPEFKGRPFDFRQLWVNGKKAVRARSVSDFEKMPRIVNYDKKNRILWVPASAIRNSQFSLLDAKAHAQHLEVVLHQMWEIGILRVKDIQVQGDSAALTFHNPEARLQFSHPWPSPMYNSKHNSPFYFVNALALLDEPGEWYHDIREGKLYYMPRKGEKLDNLVAEAPALETLVAVEGTPDRRVQNIRFENIGFHYTSWMRPSFEGHVPLQAGMYLTEAYKLRPQINRTNNHKLDNQGWLGRASAALQISHADHLDFTNCRFEHLGGSGLDYVEGCGYGKVEGCNFQDIAMNGYVAGSFSPSALETHLPYRPADLREVCHHQQVVGSTFSDVTNEDWGCVAIAAGYVSNMCISRNTIHDISYTGISLGWGWNRDSVCMHDNHVSENVIYNYAQHMYDCAGIYTLGNQPGTVIEKNEVRDIAHPTYVHDPEHWFYLYTDEGSSNITLRNNITPSEKFLKNATGPNNVWENNGPRSDTK